jgi:hypothetical protein
MSRGPKDPHESQGLQAVRASRLYLHDERSVDCVATVRGSHATAAKDPSAHTRRAADRVRAHVEIETSSVQAQGDPQGKTRS